MEFTGRIYKVLPVQRGTSKLGNDWVKQEFIFEYFERDNDRFADRVLLALMNDQVEKYAVKEYDKVRIGFGHTTREYNGRYFNELRMYRFEKLDGQEAPAPVETKTEEDDRPF